MKNHEKRKLSEPIRVLNREDTHHELGDVAEGGVQEAAQGLVRVLGHVFGHEGDALGERD